MHRPPSALWVRPVAVPRFRGSQSALRIPTLPLRARHARPEPPKPRTQNRAYSYPPTRAENSTKPCDTGSPAASLSPSYPHVDFTRLDPVWPDKTSPKAYRYAHSRAAILARGADALEALHRRPEDLVFVVSHSGFLRSGVVGWWFFNADYRIYRFDDAPPAAEQGGNDAGNAQQTMTTARSLLTQDESTLAGGLGLSHAFAVELGAELPGEGEVPEEDLVV